MGMVCCGFGHKNVYENITIKLDNSIELTIQQGCDLFYTGAMGEFDSLFSSAVRKAKNTYPHIKLICVKPYFTNDINTNRDYYTSMYDDIIIPHELAGIHYKAAIKARNRWIIDHSDIVIVYAVRNFGGAYNALIDAQRKNKKLICVSCIS